MLPRSWQAASAVTYRIVADRDLKVDLLAGARALDLRQKLRWALAGNVGPVAPPDRAGTRELDEQNWDATGAASVWLKFVRRQFD